MSAQITSARLLSCARCGGDHADVEWQPLERPVLEDGKTVATHWAPCPTNGQPILMIQVEREDSDRS
ncbi:MAG: hypothetical protein ITG02_01130 [Patulibacter sp.]|nr:hypothetical protein [Patulibacter sp.]